MAIESLNIGVRMCDRVVKMVEAGKTVEEIQEYFELQRNYYKAMLREGTGRSQSDWDMEEEMFQASLVDSEDEPAIIGLMNRLKDKVVDVVEDIFDGPDEPKEESKAEPKPKPKNEPTAINRMLTSNDIRG
jgi:hypothetical protein